MIEVVPVCRMCLEPVCSSICPECLFSHLRLWTKNKGPTVAGEIDAVHFSLSFSFPQTDANRELCVRCHKTTQTVTCPCCYIQEMVHSLRTVDEAAAQELIENFNYDFEDRNYFRAPPWSPIGFILNKVSEGVCEICDNEDDRLYEYDGAFACADCLEYEDGFWGVRYNGVGVSI